MTDPITREQVERAIRCVEHATGEPELVAAETPRKVARWDARVGVLAKADPERPAPRFKVGDLDPELRETARQMVAALRLGSFVPSGYVALPGAAEWRVSDHSPEADARWADQLDALLGEPATPPAPEVVDVPQPLVIRKRLAGSEHSAAWSSDEPDVVTLYIGGAGEDAPLALLRAMLAAIDAQDRMVAIKGHHARWDAQLAPTRPEPRYKVGDWAADNETGARGIISRAEWSATQAQWRYDMGSVDYPESHLTPAIDPALRETARTAARMLLCGKWPMHLPRVRELPGFDAWNSGPLRSSEWAAQLERLLGDAP